MPMQVPTHLPAECIVCPMGRGDKAESIAQLFTNLIRVLCALQLAPLSSITEQGAITGLVRTSGLAYTPQRQVNRNSIYGDEAKWMLPGHIFGKQGLWQAARPLPHLSAPRCT